MKLGVVNTLTIDRKTRVGLFLTDGTTDVLLPNKYVPKEYEIGDEIAVFVYLDHEERLVATTLKPYINLNEFAWLQVSYVNQFGAFVNWGLEKDLFVPFREQARKMEVGKRYMIYLFIDEKTNRLVGSSRIDHFLDNENLTVTEGDEVVVLVSHITDLGANVIINNKHKGLVFSNDMYDTISPGKKLTAFIKTIRPDGKIDVTLQKTGTEGIEDQTQIVLNELRANKGFLGLNDNSHPEEIKTVLKMSKKAFKKAVGNLYKNRLIVMEENGIRLVK